MSRNLLRKTKRENVQTLLYQTLNFARVVGAPTPTKAAEKFYSKLRYLTAEASSRAAALGLSAALTTHCVVIHYRLVRFACPPLRSQ